MAITYPLNLLEDFPGWSTDFSLLWRQEQSRHASGRTRVKDFGTPIWQATYQSRRMSANELDHWKARLESLENGLKTFLGYPTSRCRPINYPGNSTLPSGTLTYIDSNAKAIQITTDEGFSLLVGDYIQIVSNSRRYLYQVMENATAATGTGVTNTFEIRPHLSVSSATSNVVTFYRPSVEMTIVPGSISSGSTLQNGRGTISFQAIEARG